MTNVELARRVNLSAPSVLQRVRKLEESGVIQGYAAKIDPLKLGFSLTVLAQVSLALHQVRPIEQFRAAVDKIDEITECYHVSGEYDFLLRVVVADVASYEAFVREKLSRIAGIGKIHSCIVLSTTKSAAPIPLERYSPI